MSKERTALVALLLSFLPQVVHGDCVASPYDLLRFEVMSCEDAALAIRRAARAAAGGTEDGWLKAIQAHDSGSLATLRVLEVRRIWLSWLDEKAVGNVVSLWRPVGLEEVFLFKRAASPYSEGSGSLCRDLRELGEAGLVATQPCCDTIPPDGAACLLNVRELMAVPDWIRDAIDETSP